MIKERLNQVLNTVADKVWEQSLLKGDQERAEQDTLRWGLIHQSRMQDACIMGALDYLARVTGGRVVRSRFIMQRLPALNRDLYQVEIFN